MISIFRRIVSRLKRMTNQQPESDQDWWETHILTINGVEHEIFANGPNGRTLVSFVFNPEDLHLIEDYKYPDLIEPAMSAERIKQMREEGKYPEEEIKWMEDIRCINTPLFVGEEGDNRHMGANKIASLMSVPRGFFNWQVYFDGERILTMDELEQRETVVHETDSKWSLDDMQTEEVMSYIKRFNHVFCGFWEETEFYLDRAWEVPICNPFLNADGTIDMVYAAREEQDPQGSSQSLCYVVRHDGTVFCRESNEVLDLKDFMHIMAITQTIIRDIYGDYDLESASRRHIKTFTTASEASK